MIIEETIPSDNPLIPSQYKASSSSSLILYTADQDYYGDDRVGVVAEDRLGDYSLVHILSIEIIFKPCLNNATCKVSCCIV